MMAATLHLPCPPCSLRLASTWSPRNEKTKKNSSDPSRCGAAVPLGGGAALKCGNDTTCAVRKSRSSKRPPRSRRPPASWICTARFQFRTGSAEQAKQDDDDDDAGSSCTLTEMAAALEDDLFRLHEAMNEAYKGRIGADVRNRVQVLYQRAAELKRGAGTAGVAAGDRVPVHLTATLKALQREHASVENIVRLAMEAGPVIIDVGSDPPSKLNSLQKVAAVVESTMAVASDEAPISMFNEEKEARNASLFQSLIRESAWETVAQFKTSGMASAPASQDSSLLAAFRREIECRAMEQLGENNTPTTDLRGAYKEQEQRLEKGQIQNLPVRGRLPWRRDKGALTDEEEEEVEIEAQPQNMLPGMLDQSSLTDTQQQSTSSIEKTIISKELNELRNALSVLEPQLRISNEGSAAKTQLQQVAEEMSATVPLDIHNQLVKLERESLVAARTKLAQVTAALKEKEGIISAIKQERMAEQESFTDKVKELSKELSKRISAEEAEAAINKAVRELETELQKALKRAESMRQELETKEGLLKQLQAEWAAERASLRGEIANVQEQVTEMRAEQDGVRIDLIGAVEKMTELEATVAELRQSGVETGEKSSNSSEKTGLATVRSLVTGMVKAKLAQTNSINTADSKPVELPVEALHEESSSPHSGGLEGSDRRRGSSSAEELLGSMLSEEKVLALETFFAMVGVLVERASGDMETRTERSGDVNDGRKLENEKVEANLGNVGSNPVDAEIVTKPMITLYYESTWEYAYLHYSVNNRGWTELPGVCMRNDVVVNNVPLKVISVEGSQIEFVLTDGKGSWDCAPLGGNYHIKNSGTFLLSSGCIEQKK